MFDAGSGLSDPWCWLFDRRPLSFRTVTAAARGPATAVPCRAASTYGAWWGQMCLCLCQWSAACGLVHVLAARYVSPCVCACVCVCVCVCCPRVVDGRDHRNDTLRDWIVNDFVMGPTGMGNENVSGFYFDDGWSVRACALARLRFHTCAHMLFTLSGKACDADVNPVCVCLCTSVCACTRVCFLMRFCIVRTRPAPSPRGCPRRASVTTAPSVAPRRRTCTAPRTWALPRCGAASPARHLLGHASFRLGAVLVLGQNEVALWPAVKCRCINFCYSLYAPAVSCANSVCVCVCVCCRYVVCARAGGHHRHQDRMGDDDGGSDQRRPRRQRLDMAGPCAVPGRVALEWDLSRVDAGRVP